MTHSRPEPFLPSGHLNPESFLPSAFAAMEQALIATRDNGWETLRSPHIFMGLLQSPEKPLRDWAFRLGTDCSKLNRQFKRLFFRPSEQEPFVLLHREFCSKTFIEAVRMAADRCVKSDRDKISQTDLLWAVLSVDGCVASCFKQSGIATPVLRVLITESERFANASV